jgi:carnitine O-acetyltransferase
MSTSTIKLTQRPSGWKATAPGAPHGTQTYSSKLPKLPVPDLQETLGRLKQSLKPIAWSDLEYASVEKKIDEFGVSKGPKLQERLLERAEETPHWLEEWWDDAGYLGYRDSVR